MSKEKFIRNFSKWLKKNNELPSFVYYDMFSEIHTDERGGWLISNFGTFRFFKAQNSWSRPREVSLSKNDVLSYLSQKREMPALENPAKII